METFAIDFFGADKAFAFVSIANSMAILSPYMYLRLQWLLIIHAKYTNLIRVIICGESDASTINQ
jgi:hypothetical protein